MLAQTRIKWNCDGPHLLPLIVQLAIKSFNYKARYGHESTQITVWLWYDTKPCVSNLQSMEGDRRAQDGWDTISELGKEWRKIWMRNWRLLVNRRALAGAKNDGISCLHCRLSLIALGDKETKLRPRCFNTKSRAGDNYSVSPTDSLPRRSKCGNYQSTSHENN